MYVVQQAENIRELMNLKPMSVLNLFAAESLAISKHGINTRAQTRGRAGDDKVVGGNCGVKSKYRAIIGRADHQRLFSPSVSVLRVIVLFQYMYKPHLHINRIICLCKHSPILQPSWRWCSINMFQSACLRS
ncbi:hypothetical protein TNCV_2748401 [Trichonephila clavipes]|nr:hypothetical protein TNCV_2748401 [Trichonephila clavipes]